MDSRRKRKPDLANDGNGFERRAEIIKGCSPSCGAGEKKRNEILQLAAGRTRCSLFARDALQIVSNRFKYVAGLTPLSLGHSRHISQQWSKFVAALFSFQGSHE
jgi:hypothetical protein